jgi:hypothetical protein
MDFEKTKCCIIVATGSGTTWTNKKDFKVYTLATHAVACSQWVSWHQLFEIMYLCRDCYCVIC